MQETIVRLKIISTSETPEKITELIGLPCDRCWHIGEMRVHTTIKEKNHGWVLESGLPKTAELEEHMNTLLSVIDTQKNVVKSLTNTAKVELSCVIYADTVPALNFDDSVINKLAYIGASLDIDLYITETNDEDE